MRAFGLSFYVCASSSSLVHSFCYVKMSLRELLRKFIIVGCNLNAKLVAAEYLAKLTDNDENNYKVFESFTGECSSTLLCIMHRLGRCGRDEALVEIIARHLEVRLCFNHEEDDAGGYIATFMRRIRNVRVSGKKNQLNLYIK